MRIGSLFAGFGGLDLAVMAVLGGDVAWHSEIDQAAVAVLAARFPDVPNVGDVTEVDWGAMVAGANRRLTPDQVASAVLPAGWICDLISPDRKPPPGRITRNDALRLAGNGVVWQQIAAGLAWLIPRHFGGRT